MKKEKDSMVKFESKIDNILERANGLLSDKSKFIGHDDIKFNLDLNTNDKDNNLKGGDKDSLTNQDKKYSSKNSKNKNKDKTDNSEKNTKNIKNNNSEMQSSIKLLENIRDSKNANCILQIENAFNDETLYKDELINGELN